MREVSGTHQRSCSGSSTTGESFNSSTSNWLGVGGVGSGSRPQSAASSPVAASREQSAGPAPGPSTMSRNNDGAYYGSGTDVTGGNGSGEREVVDGVSGVANLSGYVIGSPQASMTSPRKVLRRSIAIPGHGVFELSAEWIGERLYATEPRARADSGSDRSAGAANGRRANPSSNSSAGNGGSGGYESRSMLSRLTSLAASGASMMGLGSSHAHGGNAPSSPHASQGMGSSASSSPSLAGDGQGASPMGGFLGIGGPVLGRRVNYGWGTRGTQVSVLLIPRALLSMMLMNAIVENASIMAAYRRTLSADSEILTPNALIIAAGDVNGRRVTPAMHSTGGMDHPRSGTPPPSAVSGNTRERRGLFGRRRAASVRSLEGSSASGNALARGSDTMVPENGTEPKAPSRSRIAPELMSVDPCPSPGQTGNYGQCSHLALTASETAANRPMMGWLNRWTSTGRDKVGTSTSGSSIVREQLNAHATIRTDHDNQHIEPGLPAKSSVARSATPQTNLGLDVPMLDSDQANEMVPLLLLNYRDQVYIIQGEGDGRVHQKFRFRALPTCHTLCLSALEDTVLAIIGFANGEVLIHRDPLRTADGGYDCIGVPSAFMSVTDQPKQVMVMALAVTSERDRLITARGNGSIYIHALPTGLAPSKCQTALLAQIPSGFGITSVSVWQRQLACTSRDGMLRLYAIPDLDELINKLMNSAPIEAFAQARSHYGALLCVAWSTDGRFLATGGEDDMLTIWRVPESASEALKGIVRGSGHTSFVTSLCWFPSDHVAWDDLSVDMVSERDLALSDSLRSELYRLASVGQDGKLCIWEFDPNALPAPRRTRRGPAAPEIEPALRQTTHHDGLTCVRLAYTPNCALLVTADESGSVRMWEAAAPGLARQARDQSLSSSETGIGAAGSPSSPTQRIEYLLNAHGHRDFFKKPSDCEPAYVS